MRRLLAMTVVAGAAFALSAPAHAEPTCNAQRYGVDAAGTHAGVCAGSWCPDECFVILDPYCYQDARQSVDACAVINKL
jgi:hypothetical protein